MSDTAREQARDLNQRGIDLEEDGQILRAIESYRAAAEADPTWAAPWFNLGLLYKRQRRWEDSRDANLRALDLHPDEESASWNLGIAATALQDWESARRAWRVFGVELPEGDGPFDLGLGLVPIRTNPDAAAEVVWCSRRDPATAVIENVPLPGSGRRWKDRLLHDGEPRGYRNLGEREVPVFDELEVLEVSPFRTFRADVRAPDPTAFQALDDRGEPDGEVMIEDWSSNLQMLCRACSEGRPHEGHEPALEGGDDPARSRRFGIAARDQEEVEAVLRAWRDAGSDRAYLLELTP